MTQAEPVVLLPQGPQLIVLVPTMELGVQEAMLVYKLFGGSVNPGIPGAAANMFAYSGPRGLKVHRCCRLQCSRDEQLLFGIWEREGGQSAMKSLCLLASGGDCTHLC